MRSIIQYFPQTIEFTEWLNFGQCHEISTEKENDFSFVFLLEKCGEKFRVISEF